MRGREAFPLNSATAGTVCAIAVSNVASLATLCSEVKSSFILNGRLQALDEGLRVVSFGGEPLVRVLLSTNAGEDEREKLKESLRVLRVLDPSLRVREMDDGEMALFTAGEVHLQKCLKDLEARLVSLLL